MPSIIKDDSTVKAITTLRPLTLKQFKFVEYFCSIAKGNETESASLAGYKGDRAQLAVVGCQNLTKLSIKAAIAVRKAELRKQSDTTVAELEEMYRFAYLKGNKHTQPASMVSATTGIARLYGMDRDAGGGREQTVIIISPKRKVIDSKEI